MEAASVFTDPMAAAAAQGLRSGNLLRHSNYSISLSDSNSDKLPRAATASHISAVVATLAPPLVKPRKSLRKKRRTKRQRFGGDDMVNGENFWYYVEPGGGDGSNSGGNGFDGGSGGGSNWNSGGGGGGGFGGQNGDDSSSSPSWGSRFASDFLYEVVYWIAVSKCVHFAIKKAGRAIL